MPVVTFNQRDRPAGWNPQTGYTDPHTGYGINRPETAEGRPMSVTWDQMRGGWRSSDNSIVGAPRLRDVAPGVALAAASGGGHKVYGDSYGGVQAAEQNEVNAARQFQLALMAAHQRAQELAAQQQARSDALGLNYAQLQQSAANANQIQRNTDRQFGFQQEQAQNQLGLNYDALDSQNQNAQMRLDQGVRTADAQGVNALQRQNVSNFNQFLSDSKNGGWKNGVDWVDTYNLSPELASRAKVNLAHQQNDYMVAYDAARQSAERAQEFLNADPLYNSANTSNDRRNAIFADKAKLLKDQSIIANPETNSYEPNPKFFPTAPRVDAIQWVQGYYSLPRVKTEADVYRLVPIGGQFVIPNGAVKIRRR